MEKISRMTPDLLWISPFPPLRTGIANYSADILNAVDGIWRVGAVPEAGSRLLRYRTAREIDLSSITPNLPEVVHLGNSEFHELAFGRALTHPAILVLHDVQLHHALAVAAVRRGKIREYWRMLEREYGPEGVAAGRSLLHGAEPDDIDRFSLSEQYVRAAKVTLVHSEYAANAVRERTPEADVRVIPMGIPLPAQISPSAARRRLGLADSDFLLASVTHVNPYKRLPTVLRALRRLLTHVPHARLILAGTGSESQSMRDEIEILGLQNVVRTYGYVDETTARMVAAAADVCVNLRYPTAGETSASLLRLLGAGKPVLVSDAGASAELPDGVAIKIPVDHLEVESITKYLIELESHPQLRKDLEVASRWHVAEKHSMGRTVDAYRAALFDAYGLQLAELPRAIVEEPAPAQPAPEGKLVRSDTTVSVATAIRELDLRDSSTAIESAAAALSDLGLDRVAQPTRMSPSERLLRRVACPLCGHRVATDGKCETCGNDIVANGGLVSLRPTSGK